jgi:ketosteroid isomerase-like protein
MSSSAPSTFAAAATGASPTVRLTVSATRSTGSSSKSSNLRHSVRQGWDTCFAKLDEHLALDEELRALFEAWFEASERKDLDATMEPIAQNIVSFEHDAPLVYRGVDSVRAVCKAGFDSVPEKFRWDVPDLHVLVRGDIAVTWGLNHMHGSGVDMWSRGTRIFQKIGGRWQMIHQHVSFPYDPATGTAELELRP